MYKNVNKEVKKAGTDAKSKAYDDLHNQFERRKRDVSRLTKMRERKSMELDHVRYIKSGNQKVVNDESIGSLE